MASDGRGGGGGGGLTDRPAKLPCVVAKLEDWVQVDAVHAPPPQQQQSGVPAEQSPAAAVAPPFF